MKKKILLYLFILTPHSEMPTDSKRNKCSYGTEQLIDIHLQGAYHTHT